MVVSVLSLGACGGEQYVEIKGTPVCPNATPNAVVSATPSAGPQAPVAPVLAADEGMWLLNDFPTERVKAQYGFAPDKAWLDHARLSSVRVGRGCSGSFISKQGLVMTNHHCAEGCIANLSTKKKDLNKLGFNAQTDKEETACPGMSIDQLVDITDVTARIDGATKGKQDKAFLDAQHAEIQKAEKECVSPGFRCDVVTLYQGGRYHLYKYRRYDDVRLVFAPEAAIGFFGGDPDNFNFPRFDLDMALVRAYDNGKPVATEANYFAWSKEGPKASEPTFVTGHPGRTSRTITTAQLAFLRDIANPTRLLRWSEMRGMLTRYSAESPEKARLARPDLFRVENALKGVKGREAALLDPEFFGSKVTEERSLRARVDGDPALKEQVGGAWDAIAAAQKDAQALYIRHEMLETGWAFGSDLFDHARDLLRLTEEETKASDRLLEYSASRAERVRQRILSNEPFDRDYETMKLTASLTKMVEMLGPDDAVVKKILAGKSPAEVAQNAIKTTKLVDQKARKELLVGGKSAVVASTDPMLALAKLVDDDARAIRKTWEEKVEAVERKNGELVAKARFAAFGTSIYPDATGTLRVSIGHVEGWMEGDKKVEPFTTFGGAFDRATGKEPFALPKSWLDAKSKLDLTAKLNFVTTNDIIGGNSGSPLIDKEGKIIGLIFDGNIHSLGGDYGYEPKNNRSVAVHSGAILHALDKVYGAQRILGELTR
jgi:hypothetical protein